MGQILIEFTLLSMGVAIAIAVVNYMWGKGFY